MGDKWYALYEMTNEIWCIIVYDDDEETQLFSCVELDYTEALRKYNQIKKCKLQIDLY